MLKTHMKFGLIVFTMVVFITSMKPLLSFAQTSSGVAQETAVEAPAQPESEKEAAAKKGPESAASPTTKADIAEAEDAKSVDQPKRIPSLLFTYWQHQSILDALDSRRGGSQIPEEFLQEKGEVLGSDPVKQEKPEDREIRLGGIVFVHEKEWTIWLNEVRITPDSIPKDIVDIKVSKDFLDLKWYDKYTNKIFPIRIRPHQRFNLDTRIFLPG